MTINDKGFAVDIIETNNHDEYQVKRHYKEYEKQGF